MKAKPKGQNYIDKAEFYSHIKLHREKYLIAKAKGEQSPRVSDYIGRAFMDIAQGISERANWSGYTYVDEMRLDAVENCIKYINSFDPERSNNPFGFFSKVVWNSFIRTMSKEKKQSKIQKDTIERMVLSIDPSVHLDEFDNKDMTNALIVWLQKNEDIKNTE